MPLSRPRPQVVRSRSAPHSNERNPASAIVPAEKWKVVLLQGRSDPVLTGCSARCCSVVGRRFKAIFVKMIGRPSAPCHRERSKPKDLEDKVDVRCSKDPCISLCAETSAAVNRMAHSGGSQLGRRIEARLIASGWSALINLMNRLMFPDGAVSASGTLTKTEL